MLLTNSRMCALLCSRSLLRRWSDLAYTGPRLSLSPGERAGVRGKYSSSAFTLIELMIVVGIIAIVLTVAIPNVYRYLHPSPVQKALDAILDACRDAREVAVLGGATTALSINLKARSLSIGAASVRPVADASSSSSSEFPELNPQPRATGSSAAGKSYQLPENIRIEAVGLNGLDYTDDEHVEIRFYANGTADNFKIVLASEGNDQRLVFLDPVTGHADYEVDPQKFMQHQ
jgi:prepilin-type N-terminal cleavage/methylation domain-containing protein